MTGRLPFPGDELGSVLVAICTEPLPVASRLAPSLGPDVDAFFERALAREPERRFQSARAFAEALATLDGASVTGERMSDVIQWSAPTLATGDLDPSSYTARELARISVPAARGSTPAADSALRTPPAGAALAATAGDHATRSSGRRGTLLRPLGAGVLLLLVLGLIAFALLRTPRPDDAATREPAPSPTAQDAPRPPTDVASSARASTATPADEPPAAAAPQVPGAAASTPAARVRAPSPPAVKREPTIKEATPPAKTASSSSPPPPKKLYDPLDER
jgi:serine/threonine-protein kinase